MENVADSFALALETAGFVQGIIQGVFEVLHTHQLDSDFCLIVLIGSRIF